VKNGGSFFRGSGYPGPCDIKKKPPSINQGFFRELEFKVFFRTVNQAGFSGIFGCFSDIGYVKCRSINECGQEQKSLI
jgi:hypothetical protein